LSVDDSCVGWRTEPMITVVVCWRDRPIKSEIERHHHMISKRKAISMWQVYEPTRPLLYLRTASHRRGFKSVVCETHFLPLLYIEINQAKNFHQKKFKNRAFEVRFGYREKLICLSSYLAKV
jgi:hypothetical protein